MNPKKSVPRIESEHTSRSSSSNFERADESQSMKRAFKSGLQQNRIPDLPHLERSCLVDPRTHLEPALSALRSELIELERLASVSLLNPGVLHPARDAIQKARQATRLWDSNAAAAHDLAREAIRLQMESLIEGYRTITASYIVDARTFIETITFSSLEARLWMGRHKEARDLFGTARQLQDSNQYNEARRVFTESLLVAEFICDALTRN